MAFCVALDQRKARYELSVVRPEAILLSLCVPGERWEIEFFTDGGVEVERFVSQGVDESADVLEDALRRFED